MTIAILRFSALGDVAMTVPVVWSMAHQNAEIKIVVITQSWLCDLYKDVAPNVKVHPCEPHGKHKGIRGMYRLAKELKAEGIDVVADLHDVLRTKILRNILRLMGCTIKSINKGHSARRALLSKTHQYKPAAILKGENTNREHPSTLRPQSERYAEVFRHLGLSFQIDFKSLHLPLLKNLPKKDNEEKWIGVAPMAAHASKNYPSERLIKLLYSLMEVQSLKLFFFGREPKVKSIVSELTASFPDKVFLASDLVHGLREELRLMLSLDTMLSMDSGNMHLASLVGLRVVSIWGATHPMMGFMGYRQKEDDCVQCAYACRPCTTYGSKPRCKAPYPCLENISEQEIQTKLLS